MAVDGLPSWRFRRREWRGMDPYHLSYAWQLHLAPWSLVLLR